MTEWTGEPAPAEPVQSEAVQAEVLADPYGGPPWAPAPAPRSRRRTLVVGIAVAVLLVGGAASAVAYADHRDASRGQTVQAAPSGGTRVAALGIAAVLPA